MKNYLNINIKKLNESAIIPTYAHSEDAGLDLVAIYKEINNDYIEYGTGLALEIPKGYVGLIFPRSSNSKKDILLANSIGVIDSNYRGEIKLRFKCLKSNLNNNKTYDIGDKIGQLIILPYPKVNFIEQSELSETDRGSEGFGSTGK